MSNAVNSLSSQMLGTENSPTRTRSSALKSGFKSVFQSFSNAVQKVQSFSPQIAAVGADSTKAPTSSMELRSAVWHQDDEAVYRAIAKGADINAANKAGKTLLDEAIEEKSLPLSRYLIDCGATPNSKNLQDLTAQLELQGMRSQQLANFTLQRPRAGVVEMFSGDHFVSLQEAQLSNKPIVIFNVADESWSDCYGAVVKMFNPKDSATSLLYSETAKNYTVLRTFVKNKSQLVDVLKQVKKVMPNQPIMHWSLNGHGATMQMEMGVDKFFTVKDSAIMQSISECLDPKCIISLAGCSTAEEEVNLTRVFSHYANGRLVCGSPTAFYQVDPSMVSLDGVGPSLVPFFISAVNSSKKYVRMYSEGEEVVKLKGLTHTPNLGFGQNMWSDDDDS